MAEKTSILLPFIFDVLILSIHFPKVVEKIDISKVSVMIQEIQIDTNSRTIVSTSVCVGDF